MTRPTSQINYAAIATNYPVAGQDNNSQGFRDNFTAISAGLATAKTEITGLQTNSVLIADLSAGTPIVNNLLGSTISNALFSQFNGVYFNGGSVSAAANIDLNNGPVQAFNLTGSATLTFTNWPDSGTVGVVRVIIGNNQTGVYAPVFSTANAGTLVYDSSFPLVPPGFTNTGLPGIVQGQEGVSSVSITGVGSGYTSSATVGFTGGNPVTGAVTPTAVANYKITTAVVSGGLTWNNSTSYAIGDIAILNGVYYVAQLAHSNQNPATATTYWDALSSGNGYAVGDQLTVANNNTVLFTVGSINTTFLATTANGSPNLTGVTDFRNLAAGVTVSGTGIPNGTTILSINTSTGTVVMSANATATSANPVSVTYTSSTGPIGSLVVTLNGVFTSPVTGSLRLHAITGAGSGAIASFNFGINAVTVTTSGFGYASTPPAVSINGGGGLNATAIANLTSGTGTKKDVIEAWSVNNGATVYMRYIGRF
jgi:hypothetical protein